MGFVGAGERCFVVWPNGSDGLVARTGGEVVLVEIKIRFCEAQKTRIDLEMDWMEGGS